MSMDKLVDSTQLDADLTSVANAIRTKGGTSASLAFPADFVSAIAAIPSGGGGITVDEMALRSAPTSDVTLDNTTTQIKEYAFDMTPITGIYAPGVTTMGQYAFTNTNSLVKGIFPELLGTGGTGTGNQFRSSKIQKLAMPKFTSHNIPGNFAYGATSLDTVDVGVAPGLNNQAFYNCSSLSVVIIRKTNGICTLGNTNSLAYGTPFASGGAGGTVYIPKALYDHLGDGTSLDYKAATNWSTINGYGTITWEKLEGSPYESTGWLTL